MKRSSWSTLTIETFGMGFQSLLFWMKLLEHCGTPGRAKADYVSILVVVDEAARACSRCRSCLDCCRFQYLLFWMKRSSAVRMFFVGVVAGFQSLLLWMKGSSIADDVFQSMSAACFNPCCFWMKRSSMAHVDLCGQSLRVSILVVLDEALERRIVASLRLIIGCFNPCCSG